MDTTRLGSKGEVCTTSQAHVFVTNFDQLIACCDRSQTGKRLPAALYVHVSALSALERSLQDYENLARQHLKKLEGDPEDNPPVLHQKELLVQPDYLLYEKFAKLSRQEADWGLLDDLGKIRDRRGWQRCLEDHCAELKGHRVVWRKDADPYRVKLVRSDRQLREV